MYCVLMMATNYIPNVTMMRLIYHIFHHMNYDLHWFNLINWLIHIKYSRYCVTYSRMCTGQWSRLNPQRSLVMWDISSFNLPSVMFSQDHTFMFQFRELLLEMGWRYLLPMKIVKIPTWLLMSYIEKYFIMSYSLCWIYDQHFYIDVL
jgi:hypothetical protein